MTFLSDDDDTPLPPAVEARVRELSRQMLGGLLLRRQTRRTSLGLTAP